ncbi:O-antigen ligase family protein [Hathewaya histolytica]|uniref:O-antigen polymerase n=1 Tax=Hathewaya histolytica TaxID=1498 RepID=A0A4U9QZ76_HATHI|nr:O-antigen ligase family protein [Hathewaya histolytica]VTQ83211.1 O-antigen polymerase [Hathewaya histolytica]
MLLVLFMVISPYTTAIPCIYMTYRVLVGKIIVEKNYLNIGLFLLFIWSLIVGVLNRSITSIFSSFALLMYFCSSVYIQSYCINRDRVEKIYRCLIYFSVFSGIFGIIEKIFCLYFKENVVARFLDFTFQTIHNKRIYSTFGNPNVAGNWFAIMILVSIYFCSTDSRYNKLFYKASTLLFLVALFLTGSRGAFIGLVFGLFAFYLFKFDWNKKNIWIYILLFIFIVVVTFIPLPILNNVIAHNVDRSFHNRVGIWRGCITMAKNKPITGWGLMAVWDYGSEYIVGYNKMLFHAHNIWITFMTTLGAVGFLIYMYIKINLLRSLKVLYTQRCPFVPMLAGIQALIIGHGLVDFTMIAPQAALLFISCSAVTLSLLRQYSTVLDSKPLRIRNKLKSLFRLN